MGGIVEGKMRSLFGANRNIELLHDVSAHFIWNELRLCHPILRNVPSREPTVTLNFYQSLCYYVEMFFDMGYNQEIMRRTDYVNEMRMLKLMCGVTRK